MSDFDVMGEFSVTASIYDLAFLKPQPKSGDIVRRGLLLSPQSGLDALLSAYADQTSTALEPKLLFVSARHEGCSVLSKADYPLWVHSGLVSERSDVEDVAFVDCNLRFAMARLSFV